MPREIFNKDELLKLATNAKECRIVRRKDKIKIKIRKSKILYTYIATPNEAEEILNRINIQKNEV